MTANHGSHYEAPFHQARAVARRQQAKSLQLRAAMSPSRLWQGQGKCTDAHQLLAPIYGWFTEGFDTADLQDAKALIEALACHEYGGRWRRVSSSSMDERLRVHGTWPYLSVVPWKE